LKQGISIYDEKLHKGMLRHVIIRSSASGSVITGLVINGMPDKKIKALINELRKKFKDIIGVYCIINQEKGNAVLKADIKKIYHKKDFHETIGEKKYILDIENFFQVNNSITENIFSDTIKYGKLSKKDVVFDLYCGVGAAAIYISDFVKTAVGIELSQSSVKNALRSRMLNKAKNTGFMQGKAEDIFADAIGAYAGKNRNIKVILDPPRKGVEKSLLKILLESDVKMIFYISCYQATLARDIKILMEGFDLKKVQIFDMFPQTVHMETLAILEKTS
jgi:23S rRNA (uracil1939-C5)-methyltransferase